MILSSIGSVHITSLNRVMKTSKSPPGIPFSNPQRLPTHWKCGHCQTSVMSIRYDTHCTNCGRRRDYTATLHDQLTTSSRERPLSRRVEASVTDQEQNEGQSQVNDGKLLTPSYMHYSSEDEDVESVTAKRDEFGSLLESSTPSYIISLIQSSEDEDVESVTAKRDGHSAVFEEVLQSLPPDLRAVSRMVITLPSDAVWFSASEDKSLSNKFKAFTERISDAKWCWWPLRPTVRWLQKDETRMHWRCVSGMKANV